MRDGPTEHAGSTAPPAGAHMDDRFEGTRSAARPPQLAPSREGRTRRRAGRTFGGAHTAKVLSRNGTGSGRARPKTAVSGAGSAAGNERAGWPLFEDSRPAVVGRRRPYGKFALGESVRVIVTVENRGAFVETDVKVRVTVDAGPLEESRTLVTLEPGDRSDLEVDWTPSIATASRLDVVAEVVAVQGETHVTDNLRRLTLTFDVDDQGIVTIQYEIKAHAWIGYQAYQKVGSSPLKTEVDRLGALGNYPMFIPRDYQECDGSESGTTLLEGMVEEDDLGRSASLGAPPSGSGWDADARSSPALLVGHQLYRRAPSQHERPC